VAGLSRKTVIFRNGHLVVLPRLVVGGGSEDANTRQSAREKVFVAVYDMVERKRNVVCYT
jgi:hypothetical protein